MGLLDKVPPTIHNCSFQGKKRCTMCREVFDLENYYRLKATGKVFSYCKSCTKNNQLTRRNQAQRTARNRRTRLGIDAATATRLLQAQRGLCAICKSGTSVLKDGRERSLDLDHDHDSGEIRGFLCIRCNRGIGIFSDNIETLSAAIAYLRDPPARRFLPAVPVKPPV